MTITNRSYWSQLTHVAGQAWNRFWFEPSDGSDLCLLRIALGLVLLIWQLSFSPDLVRWFGTSGWFDAALYHRLVLDDPDLVVSGRVTYLFLGSDTSLRVAHGIGTCVLLAFLVGWQTRWSTLAALVVVLSYIHRAPFLNGAAETVLTMLLAYLVFAPAGARWSLDALRQPTNRVSVGATIARRLMQIHLVMIYAAMACLQMAGTTWWSGEAIWWMAIQPSSRLLELAWLRDSEGGVLFVNLWTHATVAMELAFAILIWNAWLRPLVLVASTVSWLLLGIATGNLGLMVTMWVANLVFIHACYGCGWSENNLSMETA